MTDVFKTTAHFAERVCGIEFPEGPQRLDDERKDWTITALQEELDEFDEADTIEDEADALADLIYFAAGRFHEMGIHGGRVFREVHRANMGKVQGELAKRPGSKGHDAIKPDGWTPPNVLDVIEGNPKLLVIGHGRHGKDTVCEMLTEYGFRFTSSSYFCAERVMLPYFRSRGIMYEDAQQCFDDRHTDCNRAVWYDQIRAFNDPDETKLARAILEENDVYCGMRSADELVACIKADVFDAIIWVDRSEHEPPEDASSCTVTRSMADLVLDNNGDLDDLRRNLETLLDKVY